MSKLVYVHGTNGSGKTTLARAVLAYAGGPRKVHALADASRARWTTTHRLGVTLLGKYDTACGGIDGIQPYSDVKRILNYIVSPASAIFAEGLVTPGLKTCTEFASMFTEAHFVLLDTPTEQCITNVKRRRDEAQNFKPYDPANLYRKQATARSWAARLKDAGLNVHTLQYPDALRLALSVLF